MPDRLSVAIVGTGIGRDHLLGFRARPDLWTVATVCDIDRGRAERLAAEFGVGQVATDLAAVLADQTVDIVDLCTPPHLHYQQISASIAAGKHVICEKPLVGSLADIDRLKALCRDAPVRLMPIFQKRFGAGLYRLRHLMAQGLAGRPFVATAETHWRRAADYYAVPWRGKWATEMGGVNLTQAIHAHDIVTHVMGPVARVFAANRTAVN
ncbi:MAG: Gfo/Idh/MocA family oxidoreductase, partial [Azospirillaceae bacterium]